MRANQIARISSDFKMYVIKSESSDKLLLKSDKKNRIDLSISHSIRQTQSTALSAAGLLRFLKPGEFGIGVTNTNAKNPVGNRL